MKQEPPTKAHTELEKEELSELGNQPLSPGWSALGELHHLFYTI